MSNKNHTFSSKPKLIKSVGISVTDFDGAPIKIGIVYKALGISLAIAFEYDEYISNPTPEDSSHSLANFEVKIGKLKVGKQIIDGSGVMNASPFLLANHGENRRIWTAHVLLGKGTPSWNSTKIHYEDDHSGHVLLSDLFVGVNLDGDEYFAPKIKLGTPMRIMRSLNKWEYIVRKDREQTYNKTGILTLLTSSLGQRRDYNPIFREFEEGQGDPCAQ